MSQFQKLRLVRLNSQFNSALIIFALLKTTHEQRSVKIKNFLVEHISKRPKDSSFNKQNKAVPMRHVTTLYYFVYLRESSNINKIVLYS